MPSPAADARSWGCRVSPDGYEGSRNPAIQHTGKPWNAQRWNGALGPRHAQPVAQSSHRSLATSCYCTDVSNRPTTEGLEEWASPRGSYGLQHNYKLGLCDSFFFPVSPFRFSRAPPCELNGSSFSSLGQGPGTFSFWTDVSTDWKNKAPVRALLRAGYAGEVVAGN